MPTKLPSYLQNEGIQGKRFLGKHAVENNFREHVIFHSVLENFGPDCNTMNLEQKCGKGRSFASHRTISELPKAF